MKPFETISSNNLLVEVADYREEAAQVKSLVFRNLNVVTAPLSAGETYYGSIFLPNDFWHHVKQDAFVHRYSEYTSHCFVKGVTFLPTVDINHAVSIEQYLQSLFANQIKQLLTLVYTKTRLEHSNSMCHQLFTVDYYHAVILDELRDYFKTNERTLEMFVDLKGEVVKLEGK